MMTSLRSLATRAVASLTGAVAFADEAGRAYRLARDYNDLRALERVLAFPGSRRG
ncbi:MAG: hypothetical protein ACOY4T_15540 [Pseudomonadota bacterium]